MKKFRKISAVSVLATSLFGSVAFAGTLEEPVVEAAAEPVFVPAQAPANDWTGAYGGLNLGYADIDGDSGIGGHNETYGLHLGYDYDFGQYVLGGELEYDKTNVDLGGLGDADSITRLKLRGGYDFGKTLLYATAGAAYLDSDIGSDTGAFAGIGVAYQVSDSFTIGGELLENRFDDIGGSGNDADATTFNLRGSFRF
ncbi:MAG: outer membrane beta-barrel protein [Sulfitobacter sp.]